MSEQQLRKERGGGSPEIGSCGEGETTRRDFLRKSGRRAMYVTPIVLSLGASVKAAALSGFDSTCGETGSPCTADGDCCDALTCTAMVCG